MFERFTDAGRQCVVLAQEEARERGSDHIRSQHLLLAISRIPHTPGAGLLSERGLTTSKIDAALHDTSAPADRDALAAVGIDLDEVRRHVEETFGPGALENTTAGKRRQKRRWGHIPFSADAKKALELAVREVKLLRHRTIGTEHILLGLLHTQTGRARSVLTAYGFALEQTRFAVADLDPDAAAG